jgi:hypothetical protein
LAVKGPVSRRDDKNVGFGQFQRPGMIPRDKIHRRAKPASPPGKARCIARKAAPHGMETSLHRELKRLYAGDAAQVEVPLLGYRIDAVADGVLVEIQHGSLGAIRDKVARLLSGHDVLVVKPIVATRRLIKRAAIDGPVVDRRLSPKRGRLLDLFDELVHFTRVFPHRRLTLETPLVDVEEWRYPGHGRRRRWRQRDHQVQDQKLLAVREVVRFQTIDDLWRLLPGDLPGPFHTGHLAAALEVDRGFAQRIAYCLRQTGAARSVAKAGNALLYERVEGTRRRRRKGA